MRSDSDLKPTMTSEDWQKWYPSLKVLDPDGWDRTDFAYSWYTEQITFEEYERRVMQSTCEGAI